MNNTLHAIMVARDHMADATMATSATLCVEEAEAAYEEGNTAAAYHWALRSLFYSVGKFSRVYQNVANLSD